MAGADAARGLPRHPHPPVAPGERAARGLSGAVPRQRRQDLRRAGRGRKSRHRSPRRQPLGECAVRLGRTLRTLGALRDRPAEGARAGHQFKRHFRLPCHDAVGLQRDAIPRARQADHRQPACAARRTRGPRPLGHAGDAHAQRPGAAGQPWARPLRP
ncbi:hypothetical protein G6F40_014436 [Rhizopus arrhizus]|nr:hypothetical protein G6F40_014436 [Rhizopus arrhizus]